MDCELVGAGESNTRVVHNQLQLQSGHLSSKDHDKGASVGRTLLEIANERWQYDFFFAVTGNLWTESNTVRSIAAKFIFCLARCVIVFAAALCIYIIALYVIHYKDHWPAVACEFFGLYVAHFLNLASILPAQRFNRPRMSLVMDPDDSMVRDSSLRSALLYGGISSCLVMVAVSIDVATVSSAWGRVVVSIANIFVALALSFNLFFLLVDVKASLLILERLHLLADTRSITMEAFASARGNIHNRVKASRLACDFIVIPCAASVIGISMAVLLFDRDRTSTGDDDKVRELEMSFIGSIIMLSKELIYLAVAFWNVARVNSRADALTRKLGDSVWGEYIGNKLT